MPNDYAVDLQTIEQSEVYVSATGVVNGRQTAVVLRLDSVPTAEPARKNHLCRALAREFKARSEGKEFPVSAIKVTL